VVTQDPNGGTEVFRGSEVNLTESTGRQPNGKPCVVN
jgi:beta-lactam-binding protein with PASTA domain